MSDALKIPLLSLKIVLCAENKLKFFAVRQF